MDDITAIMAIVCPVCGCTQFAYDDPEPGQDFSEDWPFKCGHCGRTFTYAQLLDGNSESIDATISDMGDMNTTVVTKNMLERVPLDQFDIPGLSQMIQRIESLKILVSRGDNAGKKLGTKLPGQLSGKGFKTVLSTKKDGRNITVMQSKKDPTRVVMVFYQKPQAMAVSMKGDFSNLEADLDAIKSQK